MFDSVLMWAVLAAVLGVTIVRKAVIIVRQGYEYTLERFGRYRTTLRPGFHMIVPFVNRIGHKVNMMERVLDVPSQEVISKDNAVMTVDHQSYLRTIAATAPGSSDDEPPCGGVVADVPQRRRRGAVGEQAELLLFDPVLHVAAGAVDLTVDPLGVAAVATGQRRHDEARVVLALQPLGLADHLLQRRL